MTAANVTPRGLTERQLLDITDRARCYPGQTARADLQAVLAELDRLADALTTAWLALDALATGDPHARAVAAAVLRKQGCPGWPPGGSAPPPEGAEWAAARGLLLRVARRLVRDRSRLGSRAGDADRRAGHVGASLLLALAAADLPGGDGVADLARVVNRWAADQPAVLAAAVRPDGGSEVAGG